MPYRQTIFVHLRPQKRAPKGESTLPSDLQRLQQSDRVPSGFITQGELKIHGTQLFKKSQSSTAQWSVPCYVLDVARTVNYTSQRLPYCGAATVAGSRDCSGARAVLSPRLGWLDSKEKMASSFSRPQSVPFP